MTTSPTTGSDKRFEDLLEFPTDFTFRAVCEAEPNILADCRAAVAEILSRPVSKTATQPSRKGNYVVVRLTATVLDADEIRAVYAGLDAVDGVRMVL